MKYLKVSLTLLILIYLPSNLFAISLDGLKLDQNIDNYLIISKEEKNSELRIRKFDKSIRIFLNNTFNLGTKNKNNYKDFNIPYPDYFLDRYYIYEKDNKSIYIVGLKRFEQNIAQSKFKTGECSSIRKQFIEEKIGSKVSNKKNQYLRWTSNDYVRFKDRIIFTLKEDGIIYNYLFSCYYSIFYDGEEHYISSSFIFGINNNNQIQRKIDDYLNAKEIKTFNESLIKNFKIWGNFEIIENYKVNDELYSLNDYRKLSTNLHFAEVKRLEKEEKERKEKERLEAEKKAKEEKERKEKERLEAEKKAKEEKEREERERLDAEKKAKEEKERNLEIEKEYRIAKNALKNAEYNYAELLLKAFLISYPNHSLSGDAQYWLAETFRNRQMYDEAVYAYFQSYVKYPNSEKAPISLLGLGQTLIKTGDKEQGCERIDSVKKEYPNASKYVLQKAKYSMTIHNCKETLEILKSPKKKLSLSTEDNLKARIYTCWSIPMGLPYDKKDLKVRIRLKVSDNGAVLNNKIVDYEKMSDPIYKMVAESVIRALKLCEPFKSLKGQEVILNFDPKEMF